MTLVLTITRTLAEEEKGKIVSVAVRPGKVDTDVSFLFPLRLDLRLLLELTRV
jgi:hypothetical protein